VKTKQTIITEFLSRCLGQVMYIYLQVDLSKMKQDAVSQNVC